MDKKDDKDTIQEQKDSPLIDKAKVATRENRPAEALELYEEEIQNLIQEIQDKSLPNDRRSRLKRQCSQYLSMAEVLKMEIGVDTQSEPSIDDEELEHILDVVTNIDPPEFSLDDVCGCREAIDQLKESVILPCKFPQLFTGRRRPWKGVLLYGAPGTGKTMIGRALAKEDINANFIKISAVDLISKYVDSERLIKKLFIKARSSMPCIMFIDDYEQLFSDYEHNRRIITELSVQIQGIGQNDDALHVILSACKPWDIHRGVLRRLIQILFKRVNSYSKPCILFIDDFEQLFDEDDEYNQRFRRLRTEFLYNFVHMREHVHMVVGTLQPWKIKEVFLERLNRRIYVPLPNTEARKQLIKNNLKSSRHQLEEEDFNLVADKTEGYTGADIIVAIRDALMEPVRRVQSATHFKKIEGPSPTDPNVLVNDLLTPCASTDSMAIQMSWKDITDDKLNEPILTMEDLLKGLDRTLPSLSKEEIQQYKDFSNQYSTEKTIDVEL